MTEVQKIFGFTRAEMNCVQHRLDVPDAIADCLEQSYGWHRADIEAVIDQLSNGNWTAARNINERIAAEVIRETIEGSTWLGCIYGDGNYQAEAAATRAMQGAGRKIRAIVGGDELSIPEC